MKHILIMLSLSCLLDACSAQQVQSTASAIETACQDAQASAAAAQSQLKGGALGTANSIAAYVVAACGTADAVAQVAQNPTTAEWLGTLTGQLTTLTSSGAGS
jgi:hypothetical protein